MQTLANTRTRQLFLKLGNYASAQPQIKVAPKDKFFIETVAYQRVHSYNRCCKLPYLRVYDLLGTFSHSA